jgi:HEPN domain-containing protein
MNRADFQQLAEVRIGEARVLLEADCYPGAYYLAGYAVECALKACIAKQTREYDFPEKDFVNKSWTHKLEKLPNLAELEDRLNNDRRTSNELDAY